MFQDYTTCLLENSNKFVILFKLVEETIKVGERILVFSQSLLTLDLMEAFLQERNVPSKYFLTASSAQRSYCIRNFVIVVIFIFLGQET